MRKKSLPPYHFNHFEKRKHKNQPPILALQESTLPCIPLNGQKNKNEAEGRDGHNQGEKGAPNSCEFDFGLCFSQNRCSFSTGFKIDKHRTLIGGGPLLYLSFLR